MDEERLGYVEEFGLSFEGFGLPRMVGRVLGALMVSRARELSAEELAELLGASRGSISTATRSLVQMGLVQRFSKSGERRDYFRVRPGAWGGLMRRELESLRSFREMAERGLALMEDEDPEAKHSLQEMRDLYAFWERELPTLLERFEAEQEEKSWKR
ncbi:MAG: MarR family transcriptional regulator [Rubrobacter sp.]|nr:MarR family transcriptional regulator [Rubrobacter sp.]